MRLRVYVFLSLYWWYIWMAWDLIVMPFSRSKSILSRVCACSSLCPTVPVNSNNRSDSVLLPWSMWAITEKFLMYCMSFIAGKDTIFSSRGGIDLEVGVYNKLHYYALYALLPQVLSNIDCAAIAVQEESVHPLNPESRLNNLIP